MRKTFIYLIFLIICFSSNIIAEAVKGYSGRDLDLMEMGYAAPSLGLAESECARISNPFSGYYNPAGLMGISKPQVYSLQGQLSEGVDIFSISAASSLFKSISGSISWVQMQISEIPLTATEDADLNTDIEPENYSTYFAHGLIGACSWAVSETFSLGLSGTAFLKHFTNIENGKGYGLSLTPGLLYIPSERLSLGAYLKNAFSYASWDTGTKESFAREFHGGVSYNFDWGQLFTEIQTPVGEAGPILAKAGLEINFFEMIYLRVGQSASNTNVGLGIHYGPVLFDYAFLGDSQLRFSDSARFSIGVRFD